MCGIAGEVTFGARRPDRAAIDRVSACLAARGPDGSGLVIGERMVFAHLRLSIIDPTHGSDQPMHDAAFGYDLVFNGCIFNYRELRTELERLGYVFASSGDTEVILKAHHAWGDDAPTHFAGMFAYALYEQGSGRCWLVRDRFGEKPLYFSQTPERLRFASSLPALLAGGDLDTSIDRIGLQHYFGFHAAIPAPRTVLKGVSKLPPATIMRIDPDGTIQSRRFWRLTFPARAEDQVLSNDHWADLLLPALIQAIRRRMVADVEIGVFLSGGLDSSLIVALLAAEGLPGLRTFSIGFRGQGAESGNEFPYSDLIARKFGTNHTRLSINSQDTIDNLPAVFIAMSEPMVSRDCIGFYELARQAGSVVKAVQCGQGADEMFAGYDFYRQFAGVGDAPGYYAAHVLDYPKTRLSEALAPAWLEHEDANLALLRREMATEGAIDPIEHAIAFHGTTKLAEDQLKRVDDMTMAWGVEARTPFLDHELAELAARIPPALKIAGGGKGILKHLARRILPAAVIDRPKGYFPVPEIQYPQGAVLELVRDAFASPAAKTRGIFNAAYLDRLFAAPADHKLRSGAAALWYCASLELWLQTHRL